MLSAIMPQLAGKSDHRRPAPRADGSLFLAGAANASGKKNHEDERKRRSRGIRTPPSVAIPCGHRKNRGRGPAEEQNDQTIIHHANSRSTSCVHAETAQPGVFSRLRIETSILAHAAIARREGRGAGGSPALKARRTDFLQHAARSPDCGGRSLGPCHLPIRIEA